MATEVLPFEKFDYKTYIEEREGYKLRNQSKVSSVMMMNDIFMSADAFLVSPKFIHAFFH